MKAFLTRFTICALLPFMLVWAFLYRMAREIRHGLEMAWLDMRLEVHDARRFWRAGSFPSARPRMKGDDR